jgi:hypothetical protein
MQTPSNLYDLAEHVTSPFDDKGGPINLGGTPVAMTATIAPCDGSAPHSLLFLITRLIFNPNTQPQGYQRVVSSYDICVRPTRKTGCRLEQTQPGTTETATTFTCSVSASLSGNIGYFGPTGTGGLSGSIDYSRSESFTIPDLTVFNHSRSDEDRLDLRVRFQCPHFDATNIGAAPKPVQIANIEPIIAGVWKIEFDEQPPDTFQMSVDISVAYWDLYISFGAMEWTEVAFLGAAQAVGRFFGNIFSGKSPSALPPIRNASLKQQSCRHVFSVKLPKLPPKEPKLPPT